MSNKELISVQMPEESDPKLWRSVWERARLKSCKTVFVHDIPKMTMAKVKIFWHLLNELWKIKSQRDLLVIYESLYKKLIRTSEKSESVQLLLDVILILSKSIALEMIKFSLEVDNEAVDVRGGVGM